MKAWTDEECRQIIGRFTYNGRVREDHDVWGFIAVCAMIRAAVEEARKQVFEFLRHVEADGEIREFPEVRESLRQMIEAAKAEARREERERTENLLQEVAACPNHDYICPEHVAAILARDKEPRDAER